MCISYNMRTTKLLPFPRFKNDASYLFDCLPLLETNENSFGLFPLCISSHLKGIKT